MVFDATLAARIRIRLGRRTGLSERRMFGGLAFLLNGNMCVGVRGRELIVRLDPATTDEALRDRHARPFDLMARPAKGWILIEPDGIKSVAALAKWLSLGLAYASTLPVK